MEYNLQISSWNANGISNKKSTLIQFLYDRQIDIMLLNETKLKRRDKLKIRGYTVLRKDRPNDERAGGVAILIRDEIPHAIVNTHDNTSTIEHLSIKLKDGTYITTVYNKPSNVYSRHDISELLAVGQKVLLIGDMNARHTNWNNLRNNRNGSTLFDLSQTEPIIIMYTDQPTHFPSNGSQPTTIDLVVNKNVTNISNLCSIPELDSDHNPVVFTLKGQIKNDLTRTITVYKHVNWHNFRNTLDRHITINNNITTPADIEKELLAFTNAINIAQRKHCKTFSLKPDQHILPTRILDLISEKRRARKRWQRTRAQQDKQILDRLTRDVRQELNTHTNRQWTNKLSKLSYKDGSLWKMTKALKNSRKPMPTLNQDDCTYITDQEKADVIASTFQEVHKLDLTNNSAEQNEIIDITNDITSTIHPIPTRLLASYLTTPTELKNKVKTFSNDKAPGSDNVTYRIIKNFSNKAFAQFTYIVNAILKLQYYPKSWKTAIVIPVPKFGKELSSPKNYRPISLLSGLSKLTEKVILDRLDKTDKKLKLTPTYQFGFRSGHSTTHQVVRIINDVKTHFNKNQNTVLLLLDMQKAFDKVWIDGLIFKLYNQNIPAYICNLLHSYLTDRHFQVKINNSISVSKPISAGVPQGSVLGPKLYTLYIHDLTIFPKTNTAVYADDTAIYSHSFYSSVAAKQLQIHLNILNPYFDKWKLTLNADKTEIINFTRKFTNNKIYTNVQMQGQNILPTKTVKYLGVTLDDKLTYREHIVSIIQKGYISLKHIYPLMINDRLTVETKVLLYKMLIRPILTYASPAWSGAAPTNLRKLQVFENKCLRLATNSNRYVRLNDLYNTAKIQKLTEYIQDLSQKFYSGLTHAENPLLTNITRHRQTHGHLKHKLPYQHLPIFNTPR